MAIVGHRFALLDCLVQCLEEGLDVVIRPRDVCWVLRIDTGDVAHACDIQCQGFREVLVDIISVDFRKYGKQLRTSSLDYPPSMLLFEASNANTHGHQAHPLVIGYFKLYRQVLVTTEGADTADVHY